MAYTTTRLFYDTKRKTKYFSEIAQLQFLINQRDDGGNRSVMCVTLPHSWEMMIKEFNFFYYRRKYFDKSFFELYKKNAHN